MIDINTCFGFDRWKKADASVENLLDQLSKHNIGTALTYSLKGVWYDYREGNSETLEVCIRHSCLLPVAVLDPRKIQDFAGEAKAVAKLGFKAVRVFPDEQGWSVGGMAFRKLLRAVDDCGLPLITSSPPSSLYDFAGDTGIPIVFLSVHSYRLHDTLAAFEGRPNFHAEARQLVSPDALELFVERIGAGRLLFGSNLPYHYAGSPLERIRSADISDTDRDLIRSENACRVFGLGRGGVRE